MLLSLFRCLVVSDFFDLMNCSMPGFPVLHYLPGFAQTHEETINRIHRALSPCSCILIGRNKRGKIGVGDTWMQESQLGMGQRELGGQGSPLKGCDLFVKFLKVFIEFVQYCFCCLCSEFFWGDTGIWGLDPQPGIKPTLPEMEGKVLTTGPPGKSLRL